jgi:hypothetical protein
MGGVYGEGVEGVEFMTISSKDTKRRSVRELAKSLVLAREINGIPEKMIPVLEAAGEVINNLLAEIETLEALARARKPK